MKNSIVAGSLARQLEEAFQPTGRMYTVRQDGNLGLILEARACMIKGEPSGGIYIWASASAPSYSSRCFQSCKRLKKAQAHRLYQHAADLAETVRQQRADLLVTLREQVYALAESKQFDADNLPRESSTYDDMSEEECNYWLAWLRQQPAKPYPRGHLSTERQSVKGRR